MRKCLVAILMVLFVLSLAPFGFAAPPVPPGDKIPDKALDNVSEVVLENARIRSTLAKSEIITDLPVLKDLPARASITDRNGNEVPINYRVKHLVRSVEETDDYTEYLIESQVEAPVEILTDYWEDEDQNSDSKRTSDGRITQRTTAYWKLRNKTGTNKPYCQWQKIETYWTRTDTSYSIRNAKFHANVAGHEWPTTTSYSQQWTEPTGWWPFWSKPNETSLYSHSTGPYRNWSFCYPVIDSWYPNTAGTIGPVYVNGEYVTTLTTNAYLKDTI